MRACIFSSSAESEAAAACVGWGPRASLLKLGQGQKAAALIGMVRHQNNELNKAEIMITSRRLVFLNNMSKVLFHHALLEGAHTHTHTHTHTQPHQSYSMSTCTHLYPCSKKNKSRGKWINDKRGCRELRRNQNSFRLYLSFPINVASELEVEAKEKERLKKSSSNREGKGPQRLSVLLRREHYMLHDVIVEEMSQYVCFCV